MSKAQFDKTITKMHIVDISECIQVAMDKMKCSELAITMLNKKGLSFNKSKLHLLSARQELINLIETLNQEQE